jgi:hypothetical protein
MLSSGKKCYHMVGLHFIIWDTMLSPGANVIIWYEMLSSGTKGDENVIIWDEMLSS